MRRVFAPMLLALVACDRTELNTLPPGAAVPDTSPAGAGAVASGNLPVGGNMSSGLAQAGASATPAGGVSMGGSSAVAGIVAGGGTSRASGGMANGGIVFSSGLAGSSTGGGGSRPPGSAGASGSGGSAGSSRSSASLAGGAGRVVPSGGAGTAGAMGGIATTSAGHSAGSMVVAGSGGTSLVGGMSHVASSSASGGSNSSGGSNASGGSNPAGGTAGAAGSAGVATSGAAGSGGAVALPICGNGLIETGEACDQGASNRDQPAFWVTQMGRAFAATPLMRVASSADFYHRTSASAHTGFEALQTSRIMLYLDKSTRVLSLVVTHGIDNNTTGQTQPASQVQILFSGLPNGTTVAVSDDDNALSMTSSSSATGKWGFNGNSDGGVLAGLTTPGDWEVQISPAFLKGITTWTWVQSDGSFVSLDLTQPLTIKAFATPSPCKPNCTLPRCGDGILDGGEICDDGGVLPGNGCTSDCMSFK